MFKQRRNMGKLAVVIVLFLISSILMPGIAHAVTLGNPFPVATTTGQELALGGAFDGTNYLVGIQGDATQGNKITAQLVSQSGALVGSRISVGRAGSAPLVAFDGTNYLMVWSDYEISDNNPLYGVFIRKDGSVINPPFVIEPGPLSESEIGGISFGGGKYMVVYHKIAEGIREAVYGRLISPSGIVEYGFIISTGYGNQGLNSVAFDGTNFFVVWNNNTINNEVRGRFVSSSGTLGTEITVKASGLPNDNPLTVAFDGTNYLVVWTDQVSGNNWDAFGQLVTPAGALSGGKISISTAPGHQFLPLIAFDGTNYLISWTDMRNDANGNWTCDAGEGTCWDIRGQFVSRSGALVGSEFIINNDAGNQLGGFAGQAVNGRLLGMINTGVAVSGTGNLLWGDVYGVAMLAEKIPINGTCGTSNGATFTSAPTANLCSLGGTTVVSGSGPWTWSCIGSDGGTTADCTANIQTWTVTPSAGSGGIISPNSAQTVNHGSTVSFSVALNAGYTASVGGTCGGTLSGYTYTTNPIIDNCTVVATFSDIPVNGACGTSNGQTFTSAPTGNFCDAGSATLVTGNGPWAWSCVGSNGGSTASCSANIQPWAEGVIRLPQTGQTTCYDSAGTEIACAGTGQDGELQAGAAWPAPRFTSGTGTEADCMIDNLTGLMWPKNGDLPNGTKNWNDAIDYPRTLTLCGHSDWRLPNIIELESLANDSQSNPGSWLNTQGFSNAQSSGYWSSTSVATSLGFAWYMDMPGRVYSTLKDHYFYVWPVRVGQFGAFGNSVIWQTGQTTSYRAGDDGDLKQGVTWPSPRFTDHNTGEVTDNLTGLVWTKDANVPGPPACSPAIWKTWQGALDYIKCLNAQNYLDHTDWRLPNRKELRSLADYSKTNPALMSGNPFSSVQNDYWSSTTYAANTAEAWHVDNYGDVGSISKGEGLNGARNYVWPVRTAQAGAFYNLVIFKSGIGSGTVTSTPSGINCGSQCSAYFNPGTPVTLEATADTGATFTGWSGSGCIDTGTCVVTMDAAKTVMAIFTLTPVNGVCGTSNGQTFTSAPTTNLCSIGSPTTISGTGPWTWNCAGLGEGTTAVCTANAFTPDTYMLTVNRAGTGMGAITGTSTAITGTPHNGTLINGPTWTAGKYNNGLSLSNGQYISVPHDDSLNITGNLTISMWVKPDSITCSGPDPAYVLVSKRSSNIQEPYEFMIGCGGTLRYGAWGTNILWPGAASTGTITTGIWQHVAMTRSFSGITATVTFYINGISAGSSSQDSGPTLTNSDPLWISRSGYFTGYTNEGSYSGPMDEVQIYDRALSSSEIAQIYNNSYSSVTNIVGNWKLDETSGTTAFDSKSETNLFYCGEDCQKVYNQGTVVLITATPASGSTFAGWSGDADCSDGQVTMDAAKNCTATFALDAINGICGTSNGGTYTSAPTANLCSVGTPTSVGGSGPWTWSCAGSGGGTTADCTANILNTLTCIGDVNGDDAVNLADAILTLKVMMGMNPTGIKANYPTSGADVNNDGKLGSEEVISTLQVLSGLRLSVCNQATPIDGVCGSSNGGIFTTAPSAGLCSAGSATSVSGNGPWSWSCTGADGGTTAGCAATLNVPAATLSSIVVTPLTASIPMGLTQRFVATGTYSDGTSADISNTVTWTSGTIGVATIVSPGIATGLSVGTTTITATSGAKSGSATLTVTSATLVWIEVWVGSNGQGNTNTILTKDASGTITTTGQWTYNYQGATVTCLISAGNMTITGTNVTLTGTGTATNPAAPAGYQTSSFTLSLTGTMSGGQGSGTFTITFQTVGWPSSISGNWTAQKQSGSGVTN